MGGVRGAIAAVFGHDPGGGGGSSMGGVRDAIAAC